MDVEPARHFRQQDAPFFAACGRQQRLADQRPDRRIAVVRRHVEQPLLDRVQSVRWHADHRSGVVHSQEDCAAFGIGERHQLAGQVLGVGGGHAPPAQPQLLELGAPVLAGANLFEHLRGGIEHRPMLPLCQRGFETRRQIGVAHLPKLAG